jgi:hypothetical protein
MRHVMRVCVLILALALTAGYKACGSAKPGSATPVISGLSAPKPAGPPPSATPSKRVDFTTQIRPLLESRCTPCHFAGGTMYERLPFDRPETITKLGEKLFTRISDEKERQLIREFLTQQAEQDQDHP